MAVYVLAPVLLVGVPFLLYCLWNFSREIRPRNAPVFFSAVPTLGSAQRTPALLQRLQNASFDLERKVVHHPDRDYPAPARVS
jgi:hypothetical protein